MALCDSKNILKDTSYRFVILKSVMYVHLDESEN